ncbi:hypothetical protein GBA52_000838 [Prunus armeniaca]|nr:hypothetical protein GBA52_000838 [Prunus armeniaca]
MTMGKRSVSSVDLEGAWRRGLFSGFVSGRESDGEAGDITCDIIENVGAWMFYRNGTGFDRDGFDAQSSTGYWLLRVEVSFT